MVNHMAISETLNYLQRINYSLKKYYLNLNIEERSVQSSTRIKSFNMIQTLNLFKNISLDESFTKEELTVYTNLGKYYKFICDSCFLEFQYDLDSSIYGKKVDYVNAKVKHIKEQLMMFCYKVESLAFEN